MNRTPPTEILRRLRGEVGFGCPVPECGNPYLSWHHFDPPWHVREHHDPAGMIALCGEHHHKADAGAFTIDQLREFKRQGAARSTEVKAKFDWMRRDLLTVVGGNFFYEAQIILEVGGKPVIWFNRDEEGYLLLNLRMLTVSDEPRARIEDSFWILRGEPEDVESPPSGKRLRLRYANGDEVGIEFLELESTDAATRRYPSGGGWDVRFPITAVEITGRVGQTKVAFTPKQVALPSFMFVGCFFRGARVAIAIPSVAK